jgi:hypothetical protein
MRRRSFLLFTIGTAACSTQASREGAPSASAAQAGALAQSAPVDSAFQGCTA